MACEKQTNYRKHHLFFTRPSIFDYLLFKNMRTSTCVLKKTLPIVAINITISINNHSTQHQNTKGFIYCFFTVFI